MALTTQQIQAAYVTFFSRPADVAGLNYWSSYAGSVADLYATFAQSKEYSSIFDSLSNSQKVAAVYQNLFGRAPELEGLNYWTLQLDKGAVTVANLALTVAAGAQSTDATIVANRVTAATAFTNSLDSGAKALAYQGDAANAVAKQWLSSVTDDASLAAANTPAKIGSVVDSMTGTSTGGASLTQSLKVDQDILTGTSGNDTFKSLVVQNSFGQQANTLGSGDILDGGAGVDTLDAKITTGVSLAGSDTMPIQPETNSIENIKLQAVLNKANGATTTVHVNAKDMKGVQTFSSNYSDADLVLMNINTSGVEKLSDMTFNMSYTGNKDGSWKQSDFKALFDQDYLTRESVSSRPTVEFMAMNEAGYDAKLQPLENVYFSKLQFTLNNKTWDLQKYLYPNGAADHAKIKTYAQFVEAVDKALKALQASPEADAAVKTVTVQAGDPFNTDISPITGLQRVGTSVRLTVDAATNGVANKLSVDATDLTLYPIAGTSNNTNRYEVARLKDQTTSTKLAVKVELEKVGLAGDGGSLTIGSMNKTDANTWGAVQTVVGKTTSGIEEFNVTVKGDASKSSSLASLQSTNNNLRIVTVATDEAQTGTFADLKIGNSNSAGNVGLKDVQTLNASGFKGNLSVTAQLTDEVVAKYLNLKDATVVNPANNVVAPAVPGADNQAFVYTGGAGNDSIKLNISSSNLAAAGTGTREDMSVKLAGGAGNDVIELKVVTNGTNTPEQASSSNWYANQKLNKNLSIDGGEGNDTIRVIGSGDVIIDGGAGDDTVYVDNMGTVGTLVFNYDRSVTAPALDLDNMKSDTSETYNLYKSTISVSYKGFETKTAAPIPDTNGKVTDLAINQAIKRAINEDAVLSKLLKAEDGPSNTLVVTSLIDGALTTTGPGAFAITLAVPQASELTFAEVTQLNTAWGTTGLTAATAVAAMTGVKALFDAKGDYKVAGPAANPTYSAVAVDGTSRMDHETDSTITGGAGNDVLVLGTGASSNDTLVYTGFGNGTDSIVNFTAGLVQKSVANNGADVIQFSGYGAKGVYLEGAWITDAGVAAAAGETYINLVQGTGAAAGSYTATQVTKGGAVDTVVGVIGVLDFGNTDLTGLVGSNFAL